MAAKDYLTQKVFLWFCQRMSVIVVLGVFLILHPSDTTAWAVMGAVVADLFHAAKNGENGNGNGK